MLTKIMKVGVPHIARSILPTMVMSEYAFLCLAEETIKEKAITEKSGQEPENYFDSLAFWEDRFPGETLFGLLDKEKNTFTPINIVGREPYEYPSIASMVITYRYY